MQLDRFARWYLFVGVVALAMAVMACDGNGAGDASSSIADWSVGQTPLVSIGGPDDRPDYIVYGVVNATRLTDGRIAVALQRSSEVKYYDSEGKHLKTVGGEGDGPGEFRAIFGMIRTAADSLVVLSRSPGLTWLDTEGEYVRSSSFSIWSIGGQPCRIGEGNWLPLADGSILTVMEDNLGISGCPPSPASPWRQTALVGKQRPNSEQFDTITIISGTERNSPNYRVYGKSAVIAAGRDRVYVADTGSDSILAMSYDGDTLDVFSMPFAARPIPASAKSADVRRFTRPDGIEQIGNAFDYPEFYPRIGRILVDEDANLWVMAYPSNTDQISSWRLARPSAFVVEDGGARWMVLAPTGDVIARVRTPSGLFPLEIGEDYVLGLSKDDFDVEEVQLYSLSR